MNNDRTMRIAGWLMSALVILILIVDAGTSLFAPAMLAEPMAETGWASERAVIIGAVALLCAIIYAVPPTAAMGAILITAFAGGIVCTHARVDPGLTPPMMIGVAIAVLAWGGLVLRDERLRALLPFRPDARA
jgi:hypothetical protein